MKYKLNLMFKQVGEKVARVLWFEGGREKFCHSVNSPLNINMIITVVIK